jgi:hypothetical protein
MDGERTIGDEELIDTFKLAGEQIRSVDQKADMALKMVQAILDCMSDAVTGQRKGSFQELLSSKYSAELGPLDQFYSDTFGNKFSDALIDELLSNNPENPDEFISGRIGETKGKYGKYLGAVPSNPNVPVEEGGEPPETPPAAGEGGAPPAETPELAKGTDGDKPPESNPASKMPKPTKSGEAPDEKKPHKKGDYRDMAETLGMFKSPKPKE